MKRSTDRILTTHVGSLPRPEELVEVMIAQDKGETVDQGDYDKRLKDAVAGVVKKQVDLGVDIVDDGEFSKRGFAVYAHERLGGLEPTGRARPSPWAESRESHAFPEFYAAEQGAKDKKPTPSSMQMACTAPLTYKGQALLDRDLANLRAAVDAAGVEEAFVPAISCSDIAGNQLNEHYASDDDFLYAIADAMNVEYKAIVDAGFLLQIDDPRLINYYVKNPQLSVDQCRAWAETQVEAINHSLKGIPEDRVRYHTCYGINMGPRVHDMEMKDFIDIVLKINAGAYSFEAANQRHEHEWRIWEDIKLADGKFIIPGVITHSAVLVEHPELVAERIMRFASVVGRENVMAGGDCGFGTQAMAEPEVHPTIVWAKFQAMAEGARIASAKLWA
jgi:5-methyltetrahydropteroyltriglutamate--homocysteine methyltransferase